jgi:hypothetical protein
LIEEDVFRLKPQVLLVGVSIDKLPVLFKTLQFNFDSSLQLTFFHANEIEVVRFGWNRWKNIGWVLVVQTEANPYLFGHLSESEKDIVGLAIRTQITKEKKWSYLI